MTDCGSYRSVAVAREAMATRFEIVLPGSDETRLRAAAEAALDEVDRLEAQLSFYRADSELSHVNRQAAHRPVRVEPQFFALLERMKRIHEVTAGAFDPTIAPLLRAWGFVGASGHLPDPEEVERARAITGMHMVKLDRDNFSVRFERPGIQLDLGGIGKGYAIERAGELLVDLGIASGIIHGGTSTVLALGTPPGSDAWLVALRQPVATGPGSTRETAPANPEQPLKVVSLCDAAMSVSAVWGKAFEADGRLFGHVLDPRLGSPVTGATMAAVVTGSATDADAFSTVLLVLGSEGMDLLTAEGVTGQLVVEPEAGAERPRISTRGTAIA